MYRKKSICQLAIAGAIVLLAVSIGLLGQSPDSKEIAAGDGSRFRVIPSFQFNEIYDLYEHLKREKRSQLITSDLVLHTTHLLVNYSLRVMEIEFLYPRLKQLSAVLTGSAHRLQKNSTSKEVTEAARGLTAYLAVGAKLLDPGFVVPGTVKEAVDADLEAIRRHSGFQLSRTLPAMEDFTQYIPRGHYTRNKIFNRYFQGMMWFQRRTFRVEEQSPEGIPGGDAWSEDMMYREARQILLITYLLQNTRIGDKPASASYNKMNELLVLFFGGIDDLDLPDVQKAAKAVWKKIPSPADLTGKDKNKIGKFISLARRAAHPKIDSSGTGRKGFALLGQRFLPDSYVLQNLVSKNGSLRYTGKREPKPFTWGVIPPYGPVRTFPRGLDIFAALGSDRALLLLDKGGDASYHGYKERLSALQKELFAVLQKGKEKSLFYALMDALKKLFHPPGRKNLPGVFSTRGWRLKQLNTALASWTEFRHDSVLYAKQSYTAVGSLLTPAVPPGYVEPYPEFYRLIRQMISKIHQQLIRLPVLPGELEANFRDFDRIMGRLIEISAKELSGSDLTEKDHRDISEFALRMEAVTEFPDAVREKIAARGDSKMPLVTDVHTDSNSRMVLQEAVGTPFLITMKIKIGNRPVELTGGVFSYYEFKHPMNDRLTDEKWQKKILKKNKSLLKFQTLYNNILP